MGTKQELKKERESALVMIKKIKSQSEAIGLVKDHKHGRTMSKMEDEYQNELQNVNKKLMITQNLHVKELEKLRKQDIAHKLEIKLKNKKIEELQNENKEIIASKERMQNDHDEFLEKMKQKFDAEMEEEIERRTTKFSEENKKLLEELNKRKSNMMEMDENEVDLSGHGGLGDNVNEIIENLKADVRRLKKDNERNETMFDKQFSIFEHKLERETKSKRELEEKVKSLQRAKEEEEAELNEQLLTLKQQLSQQKDANYVLQEHFEMISDQNIRLKKVEEDYQLVAKHIDADYSEMNRLMEELKNKTKEKEEELAQIQGFIAAHKDKDNSSESSKLQKHVVQSSATIRELADLLEQPKSASNNNEFAHEKMSIRQDQNGKMESLRSEMNMMINDKEKECEALKGELNETKQALIVQQQLVEDTMSSKVKLLSNFAAEMNRIRGEIKKQNKSRNSIIHQRS